MAAVERMPDGYIPYYGMMKKALPEEAPEKNKFKSHRLTETDQEA